ncbi:MAG: hypothetical protein IPK52_14385 [Chloroflexi bacterium]|nr:hypothetical protein [Chloroflexota bacterium]
MSAATFAAHDQLLTAAYSAAVTLIAAIVDPAALEAAPLRHRATALNAVSTLIGRLHKAKPSPLEGVTHIEWDFGEDDDDGAPLVDPHLHMQHEPQPEPLPAQLTPVQPVPAQPAAAVVAPQSVGTLRRADSAAEADPLRLEKWLRSVGYTEETVPGLLLDDPIGFDPALMLTIKGAPDNGRRSPFFDTRDPGRRTDF